MCVLHRKASDSEGSQCDHIHVTVHVGVALEISIQCTNLVDPLVCGAIQFGYLEDDIETKYQKPIHQIINFKTSTICKMDKSMKIPMKYYLTTKNYLSKEILTILESFSYNIRTTIAIRKHPTTLLILLFQNTPRQPVTHYEDYR